MSGAAGLDLLLVMLLLAYAWSGWRQGFVAALLGLTGLVGGAFLAVRVAPGLIEDHLGHSVGTSSGLLFLLPVPVVVEWWAEYLHLVRYSPSRQVVRIDMESLPTGMVMPSAGQNSMPTARTVSYRASSSAP